MSPLARRSWAAAGAITIAPGRSRLNLLMQFYPRQSIEQDHVLAFLKALRRHLRGPVACFGIA
jgi:hypothetical protein